jgi:signal transduction histidine kinase
VDFDKGLENVLLLATVEPTRPQRRFAFALAVCLIVVFVGAASFAATPLWQVYPVVPLLLAICFLSDVITATLLFSQYSITRSRALLALASGYLFAALIVVPITLTYPGLFTPTGLLGAGLQTASWLYISWHFGFPATVLAYALLKDDNSTVADVPVKSAIGWSIAVVGVSVVALTWLFTSGNDLVPRLALNETALAPLSFHLGVALVLFTAVVFGLLWARRRSVLDQWILIATLAFLLETVMSAVLVSARFTVGFYVGVVLLLFNATIVMIILLTETTRLYGRLIRSNAALQRERRNKLFNLDAMAAAISHEVKQPLGAILTNSEVATISISRSPPDLGLAAEALGDITSDVRRANELFRSVGSLFKRADQGLESVDVNGIVTEALRILRSETEEHRINVHADLTPRLPNIVGHRGQLMEVVINLIRNAIDAMSGIEEGDRLLTIESRADDRGAVSLTVRDTGPGIDPNKTEEIFEAFVTTKSWGTGLGLAICRRIVEGHGGSISASSGGERQGAVFQLALPINPANPSNR